MVVMSTILYTLGTLYIPSAMPCPYNSPIRLMTTILERRKQAQNGEMICLRVNEWWTRVKRHRSGLQVYTFSIILYCLPCYNRRRDSRYNHVSEALWSVSYPNVMPSKKLRLRPQALMLDTPELKSQWPHRLCDF